MRTRRALHVLRNTIKRVNVPVPRALQNVVEKINAAYRSSTSNLRLMPDYVIIGAMRCGTTSLHFNLIQHPAVAPASVKEVHFFDLNFHKGLSWYRSHFPTTFSKQVVKWRNGLDLITGEASPYYIFHPDAPHRLAAALPSAKIIVLLRNPVDRAYSHYLHEVESGVETLTFEEALERESVRLEGEIEKMHRDVLYKSFNHRHFSYVSRGIYVDQLNVWFALFPRRHILVIESADFWADWSRGFGRVLDFLALPHRPLPAFAEASFREHTSQMNPVTRKRLTRVFEPHNQRLYALLGTDFQWETSAV